MLRPNVACSIGNQDGYDLNGQPQFKPQRPTKCAVVRFKQIDAKTTVRADSSASRGRAQEKVHDTLILLPKTVIVDTDDRVILMGETFKVANVEKRMTITGKLDHYEVSLNLWV